MKKLLSFLCVALFFSCSSDDSNENNPVNNPDINAGLAYYINATINGDNYTAGVPSDINENSNYSSSQSYSPQYDNNGGCININYEPSLYPFFNDSLHSMGVGFIGFLNNADISCSEELDNFDTLFPVGSYEYASQSNDYGAKVNYATTADANQVYYNSYGEQNDNASFQITRVEPIDCGFSECLIISGTFSCRLYNENDATDFLDITNGEYKLVLESFNP